VRPRVPTPTCNHPPALGSLPRDVLTFVKDVIVVDDGSTGDSLHVLSMTGLLLAAGATYLPARSLWAMKLRGES
jgi:hypothetical protein